MASMGALQATSLAVVAADGVTVVAPGFGEGEPLATGFGVPHAATNRMPISSAVRLTAANHSGLPEGRPA